MPYWLSFIDTPSSFIRLLKKGKSLSCLNSLKDEGRGAPNKEGIGLLLPFDPDYPLAVFSGDILNRLG